MRLEQMYQNVLHLNFEDLMLKVEQDSVIRTARLSETSKIYVSEKKQAPRLSDEEKAILKALGLSMKDVKTLREIS